MTHRTNFEMNINRDPRQSNNVNRKGKGRGDFFLWNEKKSGCDPPVGVFLDFSPSVPLPGLREYPGPRRSWGRASPTADSGPRGPRRKPRHIRPWALGKREMAPSPPPHGGWIHSDTTVEIGRGGGVCGCGGAITPRPPGTGFPGAEGREGCHGCPEWEERGRKFIPFCWSFCLA